MKIQLVLTHDWELRGDGSGNMQRIQFDTLETLLKIYDDTGVKGSFLVEVMQQLEHLRHGKKHSELLALARRWEELVRKIYTGGHDVQMHIHPQWWRSEYVESAWKLDSSWSLLTYSKDEVRAMFTECKNYLEAVLQLVDRNYRVTVFRAGSWGLAPSDFILPLMSELGIRLDTSIVKGLVYDLPHIQLDYSSVEEPFLPFFPDMQDGRRVAVESQSLVCVPTHSFQYWSGLRSIKVLLKRMRPITPDWCKKLFLPPSATPIPGSRVGAGYRQIWHKKKNWFQHLSEVIAERATVVSDLSSLSYFEMRLMLRDIRKKARSSGVSPVPVLLNNHPKDLGDVRPIERFLAYLKRQPDVEIITTRQLLENVERGVYPIKKKEKF